MNNVFKILSLVFTVLFLWAAALQWNDPDAWVWMLIYGLAALLSVLFMVNRLSVKLAAVAALLYLAATIYNWPDTFEGFTIGEGDITNIERGREAFGLLITALVLLVYLGRLRFLKKSKL